MLCYLLPYSWGYSSVVEHSTADRQVPGSNYILTGCPLYFNNAHLFISKQGYIIMLFYLLPYSWGYISVVEHSTADREVPGSNPILQHCTFVHK